MKYNILMRLLTLILLTIWPTIILSQERKVRTEIVSIALADSVQDLFFWNGKDVSHFQANPTGLGEPLLYEGSEIFILRHSADEFTSKDPLPAPAASVKLPFHAKRVLLACFQSKNKPMKLVAYDISKSQLQEGDYRFFNFSHHSLGVMIGKQKFAIAAGKEYVATDSAWREKTTELDVTVATKQGTHFQPIYSSQWGHRPGRRNFIFLFDGSHDYQPIQICRAFDIAPRESIKNEEP